MGKRSAETELVTQRILESLARDGPANHAELMMRLGQFTARQISNALHDMSEYTGQIRKERIPGKLPVYHLPSEHVTKDERPRNVVRGRYSRPFEPMRERTGASILDWLEPR
jgi:hypothetical protein